MGVSYHGKGRGGRGENPKTRLTRDGDVVAGADSAIRMNWLTPERPPAQGSNARQMPDRWQTDVGTPIFQNPRD
jgi:hypothetical protein